MQHGRFLRRILLGRGFFVERFYTMDTSPWRRRRDPKPPCISDIALHATHVIWALFWEKRPIGAIHLLLYVYRQSISSIWIKGAFSLDCVFLQSPGAKYDTI